MNSSSQYLALVFCIAAPVWAAEPHHDHHDTHDHHSAHDRHGTPDHREHEAHVHGSAALTLVEDGGTLVVVLESPGVNLVGFEHAPESEADAAAIMRVMAELKHESDVLALQGGNCVLKSLDVQSSYPPLEPGADHDRHSENGHNAFSATYRYQCAEPAQLRSIAVPWLARHAGIEQLTVQWVVRDGQGAATLTKQRPELIFPAR
jgi:hypothetical protein